MKNLYLYLLLFIIVSGKSQNLVPNPSFETYTACPTYFSNVEDAVPWTAGCSGSSTDYYNECAVVSTALGVPHSNGGYQFARTGNGYAGHICYHPAGREYLQVKLISPLIQNKIYYVEFHVNLRNGSGACNNLGANLSVTRPYTPASYTIQYLVPHILTLGNPMITDTLNWVKISGCYLAQGGEEYLTIGSFFNDANTQIEDPNNPSYYLVDDVTVEEQLQCVTKVNELSTNNFNVKLYPNPTNGHLKIDYQQSELINQILNNNRHLQIKITDTVNKVVFTDDCKEDIDISDLENGIYFLTIYNNKHLVSTQKLVKQ